MPERGIARWIKLAMMTLILGLIASAVILGEKSKRDEQRRSVLRFDGLTSRSILEIKECLGPRSGIGLAMRQPRGQPPGHLVNGARHFSAILEKVEEGTRVRFYSRDDYPLRPKDREVLMQCVHPMFEERAGSS